ncbi:MAG: Gfo/Idh/MocA family oxidoreductase [Armatimonadetes bacterium]|nr:Gfo/Idh/MocA family oxidoreductase [Armatimonadota bacterium]
MDKLRFGIIGVGGRGMCNAKAVNARPDIEFVGTCDIRQERLDLCDQEGLAGKRFLDCRDLLDEGLDAVCINTDNDQHCEQTLAAAARGLHVYCEKPIALNVADARKMVEATRSVATVVNLSMRAAPGYQFMRQVLREERYGKLLCVGAVHPKPSGLLVQGQGHRATNDPAVWGPILMHDGVHISEWLRFMGGEVQTVVARTKTTGPDPLNEEFIHAVTTHEDDVLGALSYMAMPFIATKQYAICEQASLWPVRDSDGVRLHVAKVGADDEELPVPPLALGGDAYYVDEFLRAIREGHRPYANMADGMEGQRIVEAIRRSGQTGELVRMEDV